MAIYGKTNSQYQKIAAENNRLKGLFEEEEKSIGSYEERFDELKMLRDVLGTFVCGSTESGNLTPKITVLENGHVLDHHVLGYLAPMKFKRRGFYNLCRHPVEQMMLLNDQLKKHGIRLIYVPLPCKLAIYPEIAGAASYIPNDGMLIPQWRNMLYQLVLSGMEIVDCYSEFIRIKNENPLYSKNHHISPYGGAVIAQEISNYIKQTTLFDKPYFKAEFVQYERSIEDYVLEISGNYSSKKLGTERFDVECTGLYMDNECNIYKGNEIGSEIGIIGNCNLQSYQGTGCDITARLSYALNYPVSYIGRYLPFAKIDSIDKMPDKSLEKCKILIYVGFPSAAFVRAYRGGDIWSTELLHEEVFCDER